MSAATSWLAPDPNSVSTRMPCDPDAVPAPMARALRTGADWALAGAARLSQALLQGSGGTEPLAARGASQLSTGLRPAGRARAYSDQSKISRDCLGRPTEGRPQQPNPWMAG